MGNPACNGEKSLPKPRSTARDLSEAFLLWARRSALPLPAVPEEPLGERAQAALDRMLAGKRLAFLHDSVAAEKRPRANQDPRGHRRWWAQREHFLRQSLDAIVDGRSGDDKLILLGHYASTDLTAQADALYFVREVKAE